MLILYKAVGGNDIVWATLVCYIPLQTQQIRLNLCGEATVPRCVFDD